MRRIINNRLSIFQSDDKKDEPGVPQGSVPGPLPFLVPVDELPDSTSYYCILFARVTSLTLRVSRKMFPFHSKCLISVAAIEDCAGGCGAGGACVLRGGAPRCQCRAGWAGERCERGEPGLSLAAVG